MKMRMALLMLAIAVIHQLPPGRAIAFMPSTHEDLSDRAAELSSSLGAGGLLETVFPDLTRGLAQVVDGRPIRDHIRDGSHDEDELPRFLNHFHDPTRPWSSAGFSILVGFGDSSILWQQSEDDEYLWPKAREIYLAALLERDLDERETLFAETFKRLGHIIHLVQDVATPSHSRNDPHPFRDGFHVWAADQEDGISTVAPAVFTGDLATATAEPLAHRPIARLIDATEGNRDQATWSMDTGLAEYSNSQFLSDDRAWLWYSRPSQSAMEVVQDRYGVADRKYYRFSATSGEGETDYYVAAQKPLDRRKHPGVGNVTILDQRVLADYGRKLLPRAVGYSMAAIDHFFRGRIEISAPERFAYGRTTYEDGNTTRFDTLCFRVANDSASGQETSGKGQIWAVVHYRTSSSNLFEQPSGTLSDDPVYAVSTAREISLTRAPQEVRFDFTDGGIPANAADVWLLVVYQGELGGEEDALLVGGKDLPEPQPVDYANLTDYVCHDGEIHYVAAIPPGDSSRDPDGDGQKEIRGPYLEQGQYRRAWDTTFINTSPYDLHVPVSAVQDGVTPMTRYVILRDADNAPDFQQLRGQALFDEDGVYQGTYWGHCDLPVIRNDYNREGSFYSGNNRNPSTFDPLPLTFRRFPTTDTYRGWVGFNLQYLYVASSGGVGLGSDGFGSCLGQLEDASPELTHAPSTLAPEE